MILVGLADGQPTSMSGFRQEQMAKLAEAATQLNPNKLNGAQVLRELRCFGIPELDAGLIADCVNMHKACVWQNTDEPKEEAVRAANRFLSDNKLGIQVEMTPGRWGGKFIWETKISRD